MTGDSRSRHPQLELDPRLSLEELSRSFGCSMDWILELVDEGALDPEGDAPERWRFAGASLRRAQVAWRLARDLEINAPGVALALDLLDELDALRGQLRARGLRR